MFRRLKKTWSAENGANVIDVGGPSRPAELQKGTNKSIDDTSVAVTILHRRKNSALSKEYRCDAGKITKVTNFMGIIRFKSDDENGHFDECLFFLSSYQVKRIRTLCQIFTAGDWVAFAALKLGRGHWTALDVRHRSEVMKCYGQFKRSLPIDHTGLIEYTIRPQIRAPVGGGDVTVSKRAFRESGQKTFDQLRDGEWLRFLALEKPDQIPRGAFTAAAVEAEIPSILGLIVKRTKDTVEVWCMEVGLAIGRVDEESSYTVGHWVRFRLGAQDAVTDGCWKALDIVSTASPADVMVKVGRYIRVTALATAGVLVPRFGTVWNEKLGRMSVWRWCLKNVDIQHHQRVIVRAFYHINDERRMNTHGDAWTVYELKTAPRIPKVSAFAPAPSIIYNTQAIIEEICLSERNWYSTSSLPTCYWRLHSEKYGCIVAMPVDILPHVTDQGVMFFPQLRTGDTVRISLHPMSLGHVDQYRAFVLEKRQQMVHSESM